MSISVTDFKANADQAFFSRLTTIEHYVGFEKLNSVESVLEYLSQPNNLKELQLCLSFGITVAVFDIVQKCIASSYILANKILTESYHTQTNIIYSHQDTYFEIGIAINYKYKKFEMKKELKFRFFDYEWKSEKKLKEVIRKIQREIQLNIQMVESNIESQNGLISKFIKLINS